MTWLAQDTAACVACRGLPQGAPSIRHGHAMQKLRSEYSRRMALSTRFCDLNGHYEFSASGKEVC